MIRIPMTLRTGLTILVLAFIATSCKPLYRDAADVEYRKHGWDIGEDGSEEPDDVGDTDQTPDVIDAGDTAPDVSDGGDTLDVRDSTPTDATDTEAPDTLDAADTDETGDTAAPVDTSDTSDTTDTSDTADGDTGSPPASPCGPNKGLQAGASWPALGYCPTRHGRSSIAGPQMLSKKGTIKVTGTLSELVVDKTGAVYAGGEGGKLHKFSWDASQTKIVKHWTFSPPTPMTITSSPVVAHDGSVLVGVGATLYRVDPTSGGQLGSLSLGNGPIYGPVFATKTRLYANTRSQLVAVDWPIGGGASPSIAWRATGNGKLRSAPAVGPSGGDVYFADQAGSVHAYDAQGVKQWSFSDQSLFETVTNHPTVSANGTVYVAGTTFVSGGTSTAAVAAIDPTGKLEASYTENTILTGPITLGHNGEIYGIFSRSVVKLQQTSFGMSKTWDYTLGQQTDGGLSVDKDGTIYAGSRDLNVHGISDIGSSAQTESKGFVPQRLSTTPVLSPAGRIFVAGIETATGSDKGVLYMLE